MERNISNTRAAQEAMKGASREVISKIRQERKYAKKVARFRRWSMFYYQDSSGRVRWSLE